MAVKKLSLSWRKKCGYLAAISIVRFVQSTGDSEKIPSLKCQRLEVLFQRYVSIVYYLFTHSS